MGGSSPSAPTVIMPAETKPERFQTYIPEKSFKDLGEQMGRIEKETGKIQEQRYDEVGTPAEIGARSKGTNMLAAAAYLSSLPKDTPDTSFQTTPRPFNVKSTPSAATTVPGQAGSKTAQSTSTGTTGKSQLDYVRDAAKQNLDQAKKDYSDAIKLAKTKGRPKPTTSPTPSWAKQDAKDYLPKQYNPKTGKMEVV